MEPLGTDREITVETAGGDDTIRLEALAGGRIDGVLVSIALPFWHLANCLPRPQAVWSCETSKRSICWIPAFNGWSLTSKGSAISPMRTTRSS